MCQLDLAYSTFYCTLRRIDLKSVETFYPKSRPTGIFLIIRLQGQTAYDLVLYCSFHRFILLERRPTYCKFDVRSQELGV